MLKHEDIIKQMTLEEKCFLLSGKDFWQTRPVERLGIHSMTLALVRESGISLDRVS